MSKVSLKGRIAVVTGSSKGIGFAISNEFAENNGITVIVCSRSIQKAERVAKQIKGKAVAAEIDITSNSSVNSFLQRVLSSHGRIDILVNNAGYPFNSEIWYKKFHTNTDEELDKIIEFDLKGTVRFKAVINHMLKDGIGGVIINISSTPAIVGHVQGTPYTLAKAALIALSKHIAMEYGCNNIRAYTLTLGNIATEATFNSMSQEEKKLASEEASMKSWGKPEEVAKVAACVASCNFSFTTGNTIVIDGGSVLL
jgi:3-oxoacyl-[acyl-carrier protein] reductase